ncbi:MAG TPA: hypothetical protein VGJ80_11270 [Gemmatimonadales bacterium]
MKRVFIIVGLLVGLTTGVAKGQARVGVSLSFGDPYLAGQFVIGRPYYHRYAYPYYYRYRPAPVIVVGPRFYHAPRVVVVRPHRYYARRHHRGHW